MGQRASSGEHNTNTGIMRDSYEPAYVQLVNILRRHIATGEYQPGDRLPSESQLCQQYSVSPMTVRRAINILADQGVVVPSQGKGTFVKPLELGAATFDLHGLQVLFADEGTTVKMLEASIVSAQSRTARKLSIELGSRVVFIRRLLVLNDTPMLYHRECLIYDPTRPIVEAEMEVTALKGLFDGSRANGMKHGELSIKAAIIKPDEADVLNAQTGEAAFCISHTFYDFDDRPISWGWFIAPGDRLRFTTSVGVQD